MAYNLSLEQVAQVVTIFNQEDKYQTKLSRVAYEFIGGYLDRNKDDKESKGATFIHPLDSFTFEDLCDKMKDSGCIIGADSGANTLSYCVVIEFVERTKNS